MSIEKLLKLKRREVDAMERAYTDYLALPSPANYERYQLHVGRVSMASEMYDQAVERRLIRRRSTAEARVQYRLSEKAKAAIEQEKAALGNGAAEAEHGLR